MDSSILSALEETKPDETQHQSSTDLQTELRRLTEQLQTLQTTNRQLQLELEREKQNTNEIQTEDARLLEQMRLKLDGLTEAEAELAERLDEERRRRTELEARLEGAETTREYRSLPSGEEEGRLRSEAKELRRRLREVEVRLRDVEERERSARSELEKATEEVGKRRRELENSRVLMVRQLGFVFIFVIFFELIYWNNYLFGVFLKSVVCGLTGRNGSRHEDFKETTGKADEKIM